MDDDALIAAVAGGDDTALRELFARHAPWLAARLCTVLPAAEVEDVLQETFLAVWRGAARYRPDLGSVGGWTWGIARRQAALWLRRRGPAELLLPAVTGLDGRSPGTAELGDPAEAAFQRAELAAAVSALGPGRQPAAGDVAADVPGRPAGGRGSRADGRPGGHGEEPRVPGAPADAGRAAAPPAGAGGRQAMTRGPDMTDSEGSLPGSRPATPAIPPGLDRY